VAAGRVRAVTAKALNARSIWSSRIRKLKTFLRQQIPRKELISVCGKIATLRFSFLSIWEDLS
jgi:hypothetical protein